MAVGQLGVGEIVLAEQVDVGPGHRGVRFDGEEQFLPLSGVRRSEAHLEVEIVPADDGVFDEPVARLRDLLVVLVGVGEFPRVADGDGARETIGQLDLIQLRFDRHAQGDVIDVSQDEKGFDDPAEGLERGVEGVLLGAGIQPPKNVGGRGLFQLDGDHQPQNVLPVVARDGFVDVLLRLDRPGLAVLLGHRPKCVQGLALERFDPRRIGDLEKMGHAENRFGIAVCVGRVDARCAGTAAPCRATA